MIGKRVYIATVAGIAVLAGGFFIGRTVGDGPSGPEAWSIPSRLEGDRPRAPIPTLSTARALPSLQTTATPEEAVTPAPEPTLEATTGIQASPRPEVTAAPNG